MTGTLNSAAGAEAKARVEPEGIVRLWSAAVVGLPEHHTMLVVDWLVLACRHAGFVAQAVPMGTESGKPFGMYIEVAADAATEDHFSGMPDGNVDLLIAGEHLEMARAIQAGFADQHNTTIVSSSQREWSDVETRSTPSGVIRGYEIDSLARRAAKAYVAFDGDEVAGWYSLPAASQPGLLFGAVFGSGSIPISEEACRAAIAQLGISAPVQLEGFRRGIRLGRRTGGRAERHLTAIQFTRRRRSEIDHRSRGAYEALIERVPSVVDANHITVLQHAIHQLCEFQDAGWAQMMVQHVEQIVAIERESLSARGIEFDASVSVVPEVIRSLAAMMVYNDLAWVAATKLKASRLRSIRNVFGISRNDDWSLIDFVSIDSRDASLAKHPRQRGAEVSGQPLLQPVRVERIHTSTARGTARLRRLAMSAKWRSGTARQRLEIDTVDAYLEAVVDTLRHDHDLALIVARSGLLVQGAGAVREANRVTATTFWGRIVRQAIAMDANRDPCDPSIARLAVPFAWEQLTRSGPIAQWEFASQILGIALAHARGNSHADTLELMRQACMPRRPLD